jgi:hypothetical protein
MLLIRLDFVTKNGKEKNDLSALHNSFNCHFVAPQKKKGVLKEISSAGNHITNILKAFNKLVKLLL